MSDKISKDPITNHKQIEMEQQTLLWFWESLDQVNRAIQGTNDMEQVLSDVSDILLSIFDCDRVWIVYPCDPNAATWQLSMERTRSEYLSGLQLGREIPQNAESAALCRILLDASGPVQFNPKSEHQVPTDLAQNLSTQSLIAMTFFPKSGSPGSLALHQCTYPRVWLLQEARLFQEIGRRLADAWTHLLMFHDLQESKRNLEEAQRIAHMGHWEHNLQTNYIVGSDEIARIFGASSDYYLDQFIELVHPDDRQTIGQKIESAIHSEQTFDVEYRIVRPSGETRHIFAQGTAIRDETGEAQHLFGTLQDVTEHKLADEKLRESNERFRLLAESSLTGIYLIQDNLFRYVNPAMAHIFGYEVEEVIDKLGPMDLVYPDDRPLVTENLRRRIAGEEEAIHYEFLGLHKDGTAIEIEVYGRRIEYSGKTGVIGTLLDVTKRKQTEEALRRNREAELHFSEQLAALQEVTNQLSKAESSDDLIRQAVQLGHSRLGFDRVSIWFIEEQLGIMRGSFGTNEHGELRDERKAQVEFKHEGLAWRVFSQKEPMALVEQISLRDHLDQDVGEGDNAVAALWDGDEVVGVIFVDNLLSRIPIGEHRLEILRLYATTLGHLITRKQAEEALRTSEEQLQLALDAAQMGLWNWDITTGEVVWSQKCLALYGLPPDTQMSYERFLQALHPEDRERVDAALSRAVEERTGYDEQKRAVWPDGSVHWTASRGQVYCDAVGEPVRMTGVTFDISKWKEADEAYRASVNRFRELFNKAAMPLCFVNKEDETLQFNGHFEKTFGYSQEEIPTLNEWWQLAYPDPAYREWVIDTCAAALQRAIDTGSDIEPIEYRVTCKNGDIRTMVVYGGFIDDDLLLTFFDITERKRAEQERQAHLRFLESMDQVNRAIQGTNDLDQMMSDVLDVVLTIFDCDRAALVYPCDPKAASWHVPMERTRPEFPGVRLLGIEMPIDADVAESFRIMRAANGPVKFGPETEYPLPLEVSQRFGFQSFIGMALYPKVDNPWEFVLHQCSYSRVWKPEEERLFQEIGRRLADALTSLLSYRNLQASEEKYRSLIQKVQTAIVLHDSHGRILASNPLAQQQLGFAEDQLLGKALIDSDWHFLREDGSVMPVEEYPVSLVLATRQPLRDYKAGIHRPNQDHTTWVLANAEPEYDDKGEIAQVIVSFIDITALQQAEDALRQNREAALRFSEQLTVLQEITNQLSQAESSDDLCRQAVQLGHSRLGFDRASIWFVDEHQGIMRGSFGTDEHGQLRDERNVKIKFRRPGLAWRVFSQKESNALVEHQLLYNHEGREVGEGDNAIAALWDGDEVIGIISVDNLFTQQPISGRQLEVLRLYATTLGHLITRKQTEEALRASDARFRTLVDHAADAFYLHDNKGTILDVNQQACKSLGYSREELLGISPIKFDAGLDRSVFDQLEARLDAGEEVEFETRHRRKDGTEFPVEVRGRPFWQGERRFSVALARDISERKQAQEALTLFRTLIDHTHDVVEVIDPETGRFLDANEQAWLTLGYSREEFLTLSVPDVNPRVADQTWQKMLGEVRQSGSIVRESQHQRKDGSIFPIEININYIHLDRDYILAVVRDITERKHAEEVLRASEERFRALYRDNPSMFFTLDSDGMIISVNTFGASQLGYTTKELEGQSILNAIYEADRNIFSTQLQHCVQYPGQTNQWEFRKVRKDGSLLWVEEFARAVPDPNGAINVLIVCQNITDRKQAEIAQKQLLAQIQEQAQQVQNIINTVPEGVILLSKDQSVTLTNPVARQFLTLLAPEFQDGRLTHLGQRPLSELLTSPPKGLWHEITHNDFIFEAITRPVENGPDNGGWVLVLRDITQEHEIQQRVQRQERLAAVGQLAAGIAHDFNNILAVIALYTQLISRTVEMPTGIQDRLHTIEQQIKRATDLIQQILDFSRQSILERQPLDLLPFMEKLVTLLERTLPEHILVELFHTAEAYFIQADPSRIQQVLMNLAVNARDAMPEGGSLKIRLAHMQSDKPKPMSVQDLPPGEWVQIEVTDSGDGIPQEILAHIFEPFFTTKKVGEGTGLGLAQVYGIVQQHEGYIDVTTEVAQGTSFLLYFPALNIDTNTMEFPDKVELQLGQGQRVLLVEDNQATREALQDSLDQLNYDVLAATNGREALDILATEATEIDLILSDVVMPEMGGVALFHAIKEQNLTIPMVLLTGHPLGKEMENLKAMGLSGWLQKPPNLVNLSYLLAEILAN